MLTPAIGMVGSVWESCFQWIPCGKDMLDISKESRALGARGKTLMLKLFYAVNTCALASHIALAEAGALYETVRLEFGSDDQRNPKYLAINPKGRVPTLITDRGILTETPAILAFVAQSYPKARLAPLGDPFDFARVQAFNSYLCSTVQVAHAHPPLG